MKSRGKQEEGKRKIRERERERERKENEKATQYNTKLWYINDNHMNKMQNKQNMQEREEILGIKKKEERKKLRK